MPRVASAELATLHLRALPLLAGHTLHDVWGVDLPAAGDATIAELRDAMSGPGAAAPPRVVRLLFALRRGLGRLLDWDRGGGSADRDAFLRTVPEDLARASDVAPGTPEGPFTTLYRLPDEAAYRALNATVDALVVVALVPAGQGRRLYWATYLRPVGRITPLYMALVDPFRRWIVYPGLERWLQGAVSRPPREK